MNFLNKQSRRRLLATSVLTVLWWVVLGPGLALADCSTPEQNIFVSEVLQQGDGSAYGSLNNIYVFNHDLAGCHPYNFWATAHLKTFQGDKWAEVGYDDTLNGLNQEIWDVFLEAGINYDQATCGPTESYFINPNQYVLFKVTNKPNTTNFNLYVDYGSGWILLGSCDNSFSHGTAMGETGRKGETATGARDDHKGLQYKNSAGTWRSSSDIFVNQDTISNWHYFKCTHTRYVVLKDGTPNSC
jgi:hypothetical protein